MATISTVATEMRPMRSGKDSSACLPSCGVWPGKPMQGSDCGGSWNADGSGGILGAFIEFCQFDILRCLRKYIRRMRKSPILDALFPEVRQEILAATLLSPEKSWYL